MNDVILTSNSIGVSAEDVRQAVSWLARNAHGMDMQKWQDVSATLLRAAETISNLRADAEGHRGSPETRAVPQAPETDERYNVSDSLLETLIEVAQDNGFRDVVEALRELQVRRGRPSEKAREQRTAAEEWENAKAVMSGEMPPCECTLRDKAPSAYHNAKCPRYVADKL